MQSDGHRLLVNGLQKSGARLVVHLVENPDYRASNIPRGTFAFSRVHSRPSQAEPKAYFTVTLGKEPISREGTRMNASSGVLRGIRVEIAAGSATPSMTQ